MAYTGAWKRSTVTPTVVPIHPQPDPAHAQPGDANAVGAFNWQDSTSAPGLPGEWLGDQQLQLPTQLGMGYDATPQDHAVGLGAGDGLTTAEAIDAMTAAHGQDFGAVDARRFSPAPFRDGEYTVTRVADEHGAGDSPAYPAMRYEQGAGVASDPYARTGSREVRIRNRAIDMHRYEVEMHGPIGRYAAMPYDAPAQANGNQYVSPELMFAHDGTTLPPDKYVAPMIRRAPGNSADQASVDGVTALADTPAQYGLPVGWL